MLKRLAIAGIIAASGAEAQEGDICGVAYGKLEYTSEVCRCGNIASATDRLDCFDRYDAIGRAQSRAILQIIGNVAETKEGRDAIRRILEEAEN